jgi:hypothetical protein
MLCGLKLQNMAKCINLFKFNLHLKYKVPNTSKFELISILEFN